MAEIVNLRSVRKTRDKAAQKRQADANAVKFGRNKAEKTRDQAEAVKTQRDLDGHQVE